MGSSKTTEFYTHITPKGFEQIKNSDIICIYKKMLYLSIDNDMDLQTFQ